MSFSVSPSQNRLLASLPEAERQRWLPQLEPVEMPLGQVLYESGTMLSHVYFPTTAIVSLLYVMENGASAEIAVVGNDGLVGISLFMGGGSTPSRACGWCLPTPRHSSTSTRLTTWHNCALKATRRPELQRDADSTPRLARASARSLPGSPA